MKTAILTDTNSGLTVEEGAKRGIYVLPMPVIVDGTCYLEGVDITHDRLFDALRKGKEVSSSQPSPGDVMSLWERVLNDGYDELVYIPMSGGLSASCHNAMQLAEEYGSKVWVADNHRISATLLESVLDAKNLADRGRSGKEIKEYLEETALEATIYLTVDSLKYLKKSGRITPAAAAIGSMLNIKPILTIQGEKLDLFSKVRGNKQSGKKMIEAVRADIATRFSAFPEERVVVATAGTFEREEDALRWLRFVQEAFPDKSVYYSPLSCSIACHVGINAVAVGAVIAAEGREDFTHGIRLG